MNEKSKVLDLNQYRPHKFKGKVKIETHEVVFDFRKIESDVFYDLDRIGGADGIFATFIDSMESIVREFVIDGDEEGARAFIDSLSQNISNVLLETLSEDLLNDDYEE